MECQTGSHDNTAKVNYTQSLWEILNHNMQEKKNDIEENNNINNPQNVIF